MKRKFGTKLTSAILALIMVFLMIPFTAFATETEAVAVASGTSSGFEVIGEGGSYGYLGHRINLLGDVNLKNAFEPCNLIVMDNSVYAERNVNNTSGGYYYTYVKDLDTYFSNVVETMDLSVEAKAKIKMVSVGVKTELGYSSDRTYSSSSQREYAILKAQKTVGEYRMESDDVAIAGWKLRDEERLITDIGALETTEDVLAFFEKYGTHIIVRYTAGGEATVTYSSEQFDTAFENKYSDYQNIKGDIGVGGMFNMSADLKNTYQSNTAGSTSDKGVSVVGNFRGGTVGLYVDSDGSYSGEALNDFYQGVKDDSTNSAVMIDERLEFLPVWKILNILLADTIASNPLIAQNIKWLEDCFTEEANTEIANFYNDYLGTEYVPEEDEQEETWRDFDDIEIITTAEQFNNIRNNLSGNYVLASNIDLSCYKNWIPIGTKEAPFTGRLFGNYNTVKGMNITSCEGYSGLFGYNSGTIKDLRVEGKMSIPLAPSLYIGAIAAYNKGTVDNCYDNVEYDIDYTSIEQFNLNLNKDTLFQSHSESNVSYNIIAGMGIYLKGNGEQITANIVVQESDNTDPVFIILEDVNICGLPYLYNGTIYNPTERPLYLFVLKDSQIKGAASSPAINVPNADLHIFGTELSIYGGNGSSGSPGENGGQNENGKQGHNGTSGCTGIIARNMYVNISSIRISGGNGGNGGYGGAGNSAWYSNENRHGGAGGAGGNGGAAVLLSSEMLISARSNVYVFGGKGGDGGAGGTSGDSGKSGIGGKGGDGGLAVISAKISRSEISYLLLKNGVGGSGGGAGTVVGKGSSGGNGTAGNNASPRATLYTPNKCYVLYDDKKTWTAAKASAEANGGYLATITSQEEQDVINELLSYGTLNDYYIGLERAENDVNVWAWVTGESFEFANWKSGEPNNSGLNEDYVGIYKDILQWNDYPNDLNGYIEEYDLVFEDESGVILDCFLGIGVGYNEGTIININQSVWKELKLNVESIENVIYESGVSEVINGESVRLDDFTVSYNGETLEKGAYKAYLNTTNAGLQAITIYCQGQERIIPVKVEQIYVEDVRIVKTGKTEFVKGAAFDVSGLAVEIEFSNGKVATLTEKAPQISYINPKTDRLGTVEVPVTFSHRLFDEAWNLVYSVDVIANKVCYIDIDTEPKTNYHVGQAFVKKGLIITVDFLDNTLVTEDYLKEYSVYKGEDGSFKIKIEENNDSLTFYPPVFDKVGAQTVTLTYFDVSTQLNVTVDEHSFDYGKHDGENHVIRCACGYEEYGEHEWDDGVVTLEPTYTEKGELTYTCEDCKMIRTEEIPVLVTPENMPTVYIDGKTVTVGSSITIDVAFENFDEIKSFMISDITYNREVLEFVSGKICVSGAAISSWDDTNMIATVAYNNNTDINGVVLQLTFNVKSDAQNGDYTIGFSAAAKYKNESGAEVAANMLIVPGVISVTDVLRGDVDGDGDVDSDDSIYLLRYTLMSDKYPINQSGDMNGDGAVDSDDAIYLLRHTLMPDKYVLH